MNENIIKYHFIIYIIRKLCVFLLIFPFLHVEWSPTFFFSFHFIIKQNTVVMRFK